MTSITRKQRHKRLSHLFTIDAHIPKLDVAGSSPASRSIFSSTYKPFHVISFIPLRPIALTHSRWGAQCNKLRAHLLPKKRAAKAMNYTLICGPGCDAVSITPKSSCRTISWKTRCAGGTGKKELAARGQRHDWPEARRDFSLVKFYRRLDF